MNRSSSFRSIRSVLLVALLTFLCKSVSASNLNWVGSTNSNWDTVAANWLGGATVYANGDAVTFDDTASTPSVTLVGLLTPASVTVNNTAQNYAFVGGGRIGGGTTLTKTGTGLLVILTNNTNSGATTIDGGVLQVGSCGVTGGLGTGNIIDNDTLIFSHSSHKTLPNIISGSGMVVKTCTGTLMLTGNSTYTGTTTVVAGRLCVNGSIASPTTVLPGATLGGNGTILGTVTVEPGGANISPGCSIGILTTGPASINGTYQCEIDNASCDLLVVNGDLDLTGATLDISELNPPTASAYVIAAYSGSLIGVFNVNNLPAGYTLDYSVAGQVGLVAVPPAGNGSFCYTEELLAQSLQQQPGLQALMDAQDIAIRDYNGAALRSSGKTSGVSFIIPVVVYVIHNGGPENIPDTQVQEQLVVLNDLFSSMGIKFCLATKEGTTLFPGPTPGIFHVPSTLTDHHTAADEAALKALSPLPPDRYLRIWVVQNIDNGNLANGSGITGYARFPADGTGLDGIVMRSDYFGGPSSLTHPANQEGKILVHEVGHYLKLYHTFHEGCAGLTAADCATAGDRVCDTPPVKVANTGCPPSPDFAARVLPPC